MNQRLLLGVMGAVALFAACRGRSTPPRSEGGPDAGDAGAPSAGEGSGGSDAGRGPGGAGGAGGIVGGGAGKAASGGKAGANGVGGAAGGGRGGSAGTAGVATAGGAGGFQGPVPCGNYDCTKLLNVRPGAPVSCENGVCVVPAESCVEGFAHCSAFTNTGCEADLRSPGSCGSCDVQCLNDTQFCTQGPSGWHCSQGCEEPTPVRCGLLCTNTLTDPAHCGSCSHRCDGGHVPGECRNGACEATGACQPEYADCDGTFGCETEINTPADCGACNRNDCGAGNATPDCSSPDGCVPPTCDTGFGRCDLSSLDCEATFGAACFPSYVGTTVVAGSPHAVGIADGGSFIVAGEFSEPQDFDPASTVDQHPPAGPTDAFVTRFAADGTYAWTRTFGGDAGVAATAARIASDDSIVVGGYFHGTADFDPGAGVETHQNGGVSAAAFITKLDPSGALVWARTVDGAIVGEVTADSTGAVYAVGIFGDAVDLDPGAGTAAPTVGSGGFVLKLDAAGDFVWAATLDGTVLDVSIAADGSAWVVGEQTSPTTLLGRTLGPTSGFFVAAFEPAGTLRTVWSPGAATRETDWANVAAGTSVLVTGAFSGAVDLDPGAGTASRHSLHANGESGFGASLSAAGAYRHAHAFLAEPLGVVASPDGGAVFLVLYGTDFDLHATSLHGYYSDGTSAWSLALSDTFFGEAVPSALVASSTHFAYWGQESTSFDYDPGPGVDTVTGTANVVTRFTF